MTYIFSLDIHELFSVQRLTETNISRVELTSKSKDLSSILSEQLLSVDTHKLITTKYNVHICYAGRP